ncbi:MAG TPA: hypothetical protein ENI67_00805 [Gammaproteobacteria bacterium]|nr:hypothetical protein [Gammaproteobacteria bacterium]
MTDTPGLTLICGAPRSGTTWIHNSLIECGLFCGVPALADEYKRRNNGDLFTDEHPETMRISIKVSNTENFLLHRLHLVKLRRILRRTAQAYSNHDRFFIESPYYCFSINAFFEIFGGKLRVVFIKRNPISVAVSMSQHVHISKLLRKNNVLDSFELHQSKLYQKEYIESKYSNQDVLTFVKRYYHQFSLIERALFKWHYFNRAFCITSCDIQKKNMLIVDYDNIAETQTSSSMQNEICNFFNFSASTRISFLRTYKYSRNRFDRSILSDKGKDLLDLVLQTTFLGDP